MMRLVVLLIAVAVIGMGIFGSDIIAGYINTNANGVNVFLTAIGVVIGVLGFWPTAKHGKKQHSSSETISSTIKNKIGGGVNLKGNFEMGNIKQNVGDQGDQSAQPSDRLMSDTQPSAVSNKTENEIKGDVTVQEGDFKMGNIEQNISSRRNRTDNLSN